MAIPLKYSIRNLFVRRVSTAMTVFVVCLVVTVFLFVLALVAGRVADSLGDGLDAQRHHHASRLAGRDAERRDEGRLRDDPLAARRREEPVGRTVRLGGAHQPREPAAGRRPDDERPGARNGPDRLFDAAGSPDPGRADVQRRNQRGDRLEEPREPVRRDEDRRHDQDGFLPVGRGRPLRCLGLGLRVGGVDRREGPPGADQAADLLFRSSSARATRKRPPATSKPSRGTRDSSSRGRRRRSTTRSR